VTDPARTTPWRLTSLMPLPEAAVRGLLGGLLERIELTVPADRSTPTVHAALDGAELVLSSWQGTSPLPFDAAAVAAAGSTLAFVQQPSVGVDSLDVESLTAAGVPLANVAGANAESVAQWCLGAALSLTRQLGWADAEVRAGNWPQTEIAGKGSVELGSLRAGILGFGTIGQRVAQLLTAFGGPVSYWSRTKRPAELEHGAVWGELDDVVAGSDLLIVVLPKTPDTTALLDDRRFGLLPSGAYLIDAGRGGVVEPAALRTALAAGKLSGAGLDVHGTEPVPADDILRSYPGVLLSPHAAGSTRQSLASIMLASIGNVRRAIDGEQVLNVVNGVDPVIRRR
jgi:D-3-phosphoglycerate dehydrogenase